MSGTKSRDTTRGVVVVLLVTSFALAIVSIVEDGNEVELESSPNSSFSVAEKELADANHMLEGLIGAEKRSNAVSVPATDLAFAQRELTKGGRHAMLASSPKTGAKSKSVFDRSETNGLWTDKQGPPYIPKVILYFGEGVNMGIGDQMRKWFGIKIGFREREWAGPRFLESFEGNHFRFLSRTNNRRIIFPPLSGPAAYLSDTAGKRLARFVKEGGNSLIVCGGVQNILFMNTILPFLGYSGGLELKWDEGPFEMQKAATKSRFRRSGVMLPGDGWGVTIASLPVGAVSYYEAPGVSVVFSLAVGKGKIIYVGNTFGGGLPQWREVLFHAAKLTPEQLIDI